MFNGAGSYRRFLNGDDNGLVEIVEEYKDGLMLFLKRYVSDVYVAEDLAEDTFFKLVINKPRYVGDSSFKAWLYTIARNLALNYLKKNSRMICRKIFAHRKKKLSNVFPKQKFWYMICLRNF